jgi:regulator of protease activity HflC (stomatin/prohibitin superfamily)
MVDPAVLAGIALLLVFLAIIIIVLLIRSVYQIQPYQQGVVTLFGSFRRVLNPGLNRVHPLSLVIRVDLRTQVLEVPRQEVITKDNSPTNVDAIIYIKVVDSPKSIFQVQDYHVATVALAQTTLRSIIGDMELDEILYNRDRINTRLRDILDEATDRWGVRVEAVEIKEVDPVGPVKAAMEEQTSAERQRRAAVLRADGEKRSAILVSEGQKRSRILQAEGLRQSKILEAEGGRMATILEAQGESQRLRILALGAGTLDAKALTVLSLDTVTGLGQGQATKILFPFEFTRLMEGASEYLGTSRTVPDRGLNTLDELEARIGKMDDILGPIPRQEELLTEIKSIEDEIKAETDESTAMVGGSIDDKVPSATPLPPPRLGPPEVMDMGSAAHRADPTPPAASSQPTPPPAAAAPDPKKKPPPSP